MQGVSHVILLAQPIKNEAKHWCTPPHTHNPQTPTQMPQMIMADIFFASRPNPPTDAVRPRSPHSTSTDTNTNTIHQLIRKMDARAPIPWPCITPSGQEHFVCVVDFHRAPKAICERMGWDYSHIGYEEYAHDTYMPDNTLLLSDSGYKWLRVFMWAWQLEARAPQI